MLHATYSTHGAAYHFCNNIIPFSLRCTIIGAACEYKNRSKLIFWLHIHNNFNFTIISIHPHHLRILLFTFHFTKTEENAERTIDRSKRKMTDEQIVPDERDRLALIHIRCMPLFHQLFCFERRSRRNKKQFTFHICG